MRSLTVGQFLLVLFISKFTLVLSMSQLLSSSRAPSFPFPVYNVNEEDVCRPCCDERRQGEQIIYAEIFRDCFSTSTLTPSIPTTTAECTPCCDTRRQGYLVIEARLVADDGCQRSIMPIMLTNIPEINLSSIGLPLHSNNTDYME